MEKENLVIAKSDSWKMFNKIAGRYDLLNQILSLGQHAAWRHRMTSMIPPASNSQFLDIATGTGDVIIDVVRHHPWIDKAVGVDMAEDMLKIGRQKLMDANIDDRVTLQQADAQSLPFADNTFNAVTISFGIRNIPDLRLALLEMFRVTKHGGCVLILEFSIPQNPLLRAGHWLYMNTFVPLAGLIFSGNWKAYQYLNQTVATFPYGDHFVRILKQFGFINIEAVPLMGGVATIYKAHKA